jgi:hypothetical protein
MAVVGVVRSVLFFGPAISTVSFKFGAESVLDLWTESTKTNGVLHDSGNVHFNRNFELLYGDGALPPAEKLTGEGLQEFNCDSAGTSLD